MGTGAERAVKVAVAVHVVIVVVFLVAVGAGAEVRTLCALGGGVLATVAWLAWTRGLLIEAALRQPPAPPPVRPSTNGVPAGLPLTDPLLAHVPPAR